MNICVFSSSSNAIHECYIQDAHQLALLIAQGKHTLVNGGANVGLMELVSQTAFSDGGKTIGIIPEKMQQNNLVSTHLTELIVTRDMQERKAIMRDSSDAFIALPGGFGTLEEILEVITLKQLAYLNKAIVFLNTNGFFDDLFRQFEKSYDEKFAKENYRKLYYIAETPQEAMDYILNYKIEDLGTKWFQVPIKD